MFTTTAGDDPVDPLIKPAVESVFDIAGAKHSPATARMKARLRQPSRPMWRAGWSGE
jgi:hypothetical protein